MTQENDKPQAVKAKTNTADNELDDQALESVSGGVGSKPAPFKNLGKGGGPVVHATDLGPKQDDPNSGGD